jgi:hypothetical protein
MYDGRPVTGGSRDYIAYFNNISRPTLAETAETAPARLRVLNAELGVFEVIYDKTIEVGAWRFFPSKVNNPTALEGALFAADATWGVGDTTELDSSFSFATMVSLYPLFPNDSRQVVTYSASSKLQASAPEVMPLGPPTYDVFVPDVSAFHRWVFNQTSVDTIPGGIELSGYELANEEHLEATAQALVAQTVPTFRDRHVGIFASAYYEPLRDRIRGAKALIMFRLAPDGTTEVKSTFPPTIPSSDLYTLVPPDMRPAVFHRLGG